MGTAARSHSTPARVAFAMGFTMALLACGKKGAPEASLTTAAVADAGLTPTAPPEDWAAAASLETTELARLALREGSGGLVAGATTPDRRKVAVHALEHGEDLLALPFLAEVAQGRDEALARKALDVAAKLAADRPRARAPEDALEVREGCDRLRDLAKTKEQPRLHRLLALRVLRQLDERGCAKDLPTVD